MVHERPTEDLPAVPLAGELGHVGVVGLGTMGRSIAAALLGAGHDVVGFDRSDEARVEARRLGVSTADSPAAVAAACGVTVACVTGDDQARSVALGEDGIAAGQGLGGAFVDCTTVSPACAEGIGREFANRGLHYLDAPISMRPPRAVLFVGGTPEALAAAEPVLRTFASTICHLGSNGAGAAGKLLSQYATYSTFAADADAIRAADELGLELEPFVEGLRHGSASSWILDCAVAGVIPDPDADWGAISTIQKDLGYTRSLAGRLPEDALSLLPPVSRLFQSVEPELRTAPISTLTMNRRQARGNHR